jgi:hypothetical protein
MHVPINFYAKALPECVFFFLREGKWYDAEGVVLTENIGQAALVADGPGFKIAAMPRDPNTPMPGNEPLLVQLVGHDEVTTFREVERNMRGQITKTKDRTLVEHK